MDAEEQEAHSRQELEWTEDEPASIAVIRAVAAVSGQDPTEMDPLYTVIDPDALDALFAPAAASGPRRHGHVEFRFADCNVTVTAAGHVYVDCED